MTTANNLNLMRNVILQTNSPLIFKKYVENCVFCQWSQEEWCKVFGDKEIPFRSMNKNHVSDEPCWERQCKLKNMTFKKFIEHIPNSAEWMYFDYKYLPQWFTKECELYKEVSWKQFGFPEKGAADTTLWAGSEGAHTPAHQDTYGCNIVVQLYGRKRWILFPPETRGLKPTRVPYEESSVYSELNFYCPNSLEPFKGLTGGRSVELCAGDALLVPRGWWHYVQNLDPLNISMNIWLPHENDGSTRVSEALIRIFVAQICKDLPEDTARLIVNPNEDDLGETPLAVLFLQLDTVAKTYMDNRRKSRRAKRQRTCDKDDTAPSTSPQNEVNLDVFMSSSEHNVAYATNMSSDDLIDMLKNNLAQCNTDIQDCEDDVDGSTTNLCLTKAVIDAFCDGNVIEQLKQNLFARLT